jgi:hypothetical protein
MIRLPVEFSTGVYTSTDIQLFDDIRINILHQSGEEMY